MSKYACGWCAGSANSTMDASWCHAKCHGACACAEVGHAMTRENVARIAAYSGRTPAQVLERHGVEPTEEAVAAVSPETAEERRKRQKREANQRFKERHSA